MYPTVAGLLHTSEFETPLCRALWQIAGELHEANLSIDLVTITSRYGGRIEPHGGTDALMAIYRSYYRASATDEYVEQIRERAAKRKLHAVLTAAEAELANLDRPFGAMLSDLEAQVLDVRPTARRGGLRKDAERVKQFVRRIENRFADPSAEAGLQTAWPDLDRLTLGFARGDCSVVAGRTSMGKSAFAIAAMRQVSLGGLQTGYVSLEMSAEQVLSRLLAIESGVPLWRIRSGRLRDEDWADVIPAFEALNPFYLCDDRGMTTDEIVTEIRRVRHKMGLDFVVVDYLQEIDEPAQAGDHQGSRLTRVMRKLRKVAQECELHVMAVSQIGRDTEKRGGSKEPALSDLSGSGGIENIADVVLLLYRDDYYNPESEKRGLMQVNVAKNRNGQTGKMDMVFDRHTQRIHDLAVRS